MSKQVAVEEVFLKKWHSDEERWWDKYGEYMTYQWKLTPALNKILKFELEQDYLKFLLHPNESLLDVGCGSGWLSMYFAENGMHVLGIDVSIQQINAANKLKSDVSMDNLDFECCDLVEWDCDGYQGKFNNVFVSAFLHHLPEVELEMIIKKIAFVLKPGGRVYMYEPLKSSEKRGLVINIIDFINSRVMFLFLGLIPKIFNQISDLHKEQLKNGYSMNSPHEAPIDVDVMKKICSNYFEIIEIKGWHLNSLGFAMQSMGLKEFLKAIYVYVAKLLYWEDKVLFNLFNWQKFSKPNRFILCSIKLVRK